MRNSNGSAAARGVVGGSRPSWPGLTARGVAGVMTLGLLGACSPEAAVETDGIILDVRAPSTPGDNPFALDDAVFVALTAEGPLVSEQTYQVTKLDKENSGSIIALSGIPYGPQRQIRVEVWSADADGNPDSVIGRGRSMPVTVGEGGKPAQQHVYVTRVNRFAPVIDDNETKTSFDARIAAGTAMLPDGQAIFIGGGTLKPDATTPYDPASYNAFYNSVVLYNPDLRQLAFLTEHPELQTQLETARIFPSIGVGGAGVVVIVGGYKKTANGPVPTNSVEILDTNTFAVGKTAVPENNCVDNAPPCVHPDLAFARAHASVTQMFPGESYFLIAGGKGDTPCTNAEGNAQPCAANTWEIWHPVAGRMVTGMLHEPRWNHTGVRVPGPGGGGYVLLVGGENDTEVIGNFEVVQYAGSFVSSAGQTECPDSTGNSCPKFEFGWEPTVRDMPKRTMPGAVYVAQPSYNYVYIAGGFTEKDRSKASARIDAFDLRTGVYVNDAGYTMKEPRGAPMMAAVLQGPRAGQVLIAGGSSNDTSHLGSAEFIYYPDPENGGAIMVVKAENEMLGGKRTLGSALALPTGHVLIAGGVGGADGRTAQTDLMLWNPF